MGRCRCKGAEIDVEEGDGHAGACGHRRGARNHISRKIGLADVDRHRVEVVVVADRQAKLEQEPLSIMKLPRSVIEADLNFAIRFPAQPSMRTER